MADLEESAEEKCNELLESWNQTAEYESGRYCEPFFDSLICWNATEAGTEAIEPCTSAPHVGIYANGGNVTKYCNPDATWWIHPGSQINQSWANYSQCVMQEWGKALGVNDLFVAGYSISLVLIVSALFIFFYFRSLHCTRITIHKNLFISFTFNNVAWILWYKLVTDANWQYDRKASSTTPGCVTLHIIIHYFLLSNYMWMLCEGLYLHTLLVVAFVEERRIMRYLYLIGWLFPVVIISIYAVCRGLLQDDIHRVMCWTSPTNFDYVFQIPVAASVILNFVFLINIVRVLLMKIRLPAATAEEQERNRASQGHRKAVRALLILIPLLGIQHFLTPYIAEEDKEAHEQKNFVAYVVVQLVVIPLQGTWVALLFCFFNSEVLSLFKKKYRQYMLTKRGADPGLSQQLPLAAIPKFADGNTGTEMINHETEFNRATGKLHSHKVSMDRSQHEPTDLHRENQVNQRQKLSSTKNHSSEKVGLLKCLKGKKATFLAIEDGHSVCKTEVNGDRDVLKKKQAVEDEHSDGEEAGTVKKLLAMNNGNP